MMATKITALIIMAVFYSAYMGKKFAQRLQGITTNQIGKGDKPRNVLLIENIMGWATFAVIPVEIISIILYPRITLIPALKSCPILQWTGLAISAVGVAFFIVAMLTMTYSWRVGIPDSDKTAFVQKGIYRISRNPAFVGFDLMYIGLLLAFPNLIHLLFAVFPVVMLHLQIRQKEKFCRKSFGNEYEAYCKRVRRYL
ncbi:MAG: methyltransferase family protein [Candidatus Cryptobacteroides sp.]